MARVKKPQPVFESLVFATPEQKVLRFLLGEPTSSFMPRVLASRLKGVRGLGGSEGIGKIVKNLEELGLVESVDNGRAIRLCEENAGILLMKTLAALCDLEGIQELAEPLSSRGILFGSRASGRARSDSDYDLFVVSNSKEEVEHTIKSHPLGKRIELLIWDPDEYETLEKKDSGLAEKLSRGIQLWGPIW
mgnify:CR=1 FL=1